MDRPRSRAPIAGVPAQCRTLASIRSSEAAERCTERGGSLGMQTLWDHRYAQRTQRMGSSAIRELLKLTEQPEIISFAGGLPGPDVFPIEEVSQACERVLAESGGQALQYGATEGFQPLREMIARHSVRYGLYITEENVLITSGSQHALD